MTAPIGRADELAATFNTFISLLADPEHADEAANVAAMLFAPSTADPQAALGELTETGNYNKARLLAQTEPDTSTQQVRQTQEITADSPAEDLVRDPRVRAMLDVLGFTEGTGNDYGRVVYGTVISAPGHPELVGQRNVRVDDLSQHPNILVRVQPGLNSTAAGRYQFLKSTWDGLGMPDFSPGSQDIAAVKLMQRRGMIEPLLNGDIRTAVFRGAPEWASLPTERGGSYYGGQPARTIQEIEARYTSSLARQQNTEPPTTPTPTTPNTNTSGVPTVTLHRGDRGAQVQALQDTLVRLGHMSREEVQTGPGIFGPKTEGAVKDFQRTNGLRVTGVADRATEDAMRSIIQGVGRGASGNIVRGLQRQLVELGYMTEAQVQTGPGIFGPKTEAALKKFQADHQLQQTGRLGATTYAALQRAQRNYSPYTVYSSGSGGVRQVSGYDQLMPHHDYQSVVRGEQTLEVRDVVLTHPGQPNAGQAVPSPITGRVVSAEWRGGYGNAVEVVNDQTGQRFLIGHLQSINVREGQQIQYGQSIGEQGSTGHSTGPHVHIESQPAVIRRWLDDLLDGRFDGVRRR